MLRAATIFEVEPSIPHAVSLIATVLPLPKVSVMDKTARVLDRRLAQSGSSLLREMRAFHRAVAVAEAIGRSISGADREPKMIVVFGVSAVADAEDVIPEAIRRAGGSVVRVGMPVDPDNLLVLGRIGDIPVVAASDERAWTMPGPKR